MKNDRIKNHENQLIAGIQAGNEDSYNQLFSKYYLVLTVFAKKYVDDLDVAREIVQDFFVHLFEIRKTIVIKTSLKSYLFQSVRNRCLNFNKQVQIRNKHLEEFKIKEVDEENPEDKISESELEIKISELVNNLPPRCKKIFRLSRMDGKKNKEIAHSLNISIRTVETQISKALKFLRTELNGSLK